MGLSLIRNHEWKTKLSDYHSQPVFFSYTIENLETNSSSSDDHNSKYVEKYIITSITITSIT